MQPIPEEVRPLRADLAAALSQIEPSVSTSGHRIYPCAVTTDDGVVHLRVFVVEALSYIREWGVWPWMDSGKRWVRAESIRSLQSSPVRLAARFANVLNAAGETGMGYVAFSVELHGGRRLHFVTGNAVDFPAWPAGVQPSEVIAVRPHDRSATYHETAKYAWAPYREQ